MTLWWHISVGLTGGDIIFSLYAYNNARQESDFLFGAQRHNQNSNILARHRV